MNPIVIPNGIPREAMTPPAPEDVVTLRDGGAGDLFLFKIGRFDPDKRWLLAMTAAGRLKKQGVRVRMLIRGGREAHGAEVLAHARRQGLAVADVRGADDATTLAAAMRAHPEADVLNLVTFLPESLIGTIYFAADYAEPFRNALVLETDDPAELVAFLGLLVTDHRVGPRLRREGKNTARAYLWDSVISQLFARLVLAAARQGVAWEGPAGGF